MLVYIHSAVFIGIEYMQDTEYNEDISLCIATVHYIPQKNVFYYGEAILISYLRKKD